MHCWNLQLLKTAVSISKVNNISADLLSGQGSAAHYFTKVNIECRKSLKAIYIGVIYKVAEILQTSKTKKMNLAKKTLL